MRKPKNYISEEAAVETVKRLFIGVDGSDALMLEDVFKAAGRSSEQESTNRNWLANKLTLLRHHSLVTPVYSYQGRKKLIAIKLTNAGRNALMPAHSTDSEILASSKGGALNDIARSVKAFRDNNPEYEVEFSVKLRST